VDHQPPHLRIAIATRQIPETAAFVRWRVKGDVLMIDQSDLSFNQDEIRELFPTITNTLFPARTLQPCFIH